MRGFSKRTLAAACCVLLLAGIALGVHWYGARKSNNDLALVFLLIPDQASAGRDMLVALWRDAASEAGVLIEPVTYHDWIGGQTRDPGKTGLIVPDGAFRNPPPALNDALDRYVEHGGALMLVYDAGLNTVAEQKLGYASDLPLQKISGFSIRSGKDQWSELRGDREFFKRISVPPGRVIDSNDPEVQLVAG